MIGYLIRRNWHKQTIILFSVFPAIVSICLLLFYLQATIMLGRLPSPTGSDDPKGFYQYSFYNPIINFSGEITILQMPIVMLLSIILWFRSPDKKQTRTLIIILAAFYLLTIALMVSDVGSWYAD